MKIDYVYKFRLYPNKEQIKLLSKHFGCVRYVYNYGLDERKKQYDLTGRGLNYYDQAKRLTALKKQEETKWLNEVSSQALQFSLRCLDVAFNGFFHKRTKFPTFKSKRSKNSFTIPQNAHIAGGRLFIPKFKNGIKCKVHRKIESDNIGKVTISKEPSGKYYVSIFVKREYNKYKKTGKSVGLDLGLKDLIITSDGKKFKNNKYLKQYRDKLKTAQKHRSRKKKGSKRYEKQGLKVSRIYEKIKNCRKDYQQKVSTQLVRDNDIICIEDLNIKGMMKNHRLAESIGDVSWYSFITMLTYKAKWNGKEIIKIDRFYPSSQRCHVCGYINKETKQLNIRQWECPICHTYHDRDINAAINILQAGINKYTSAGTVDYTNGGSIRADRKESQLSMKFEAHESLAHE